MNEKLKLFQTNVARFIQTHVIPHYEQWERNEIFPRILWNKLGARGRQ